MHTMYGLKYWWIFACANTSWWMITERKWWMWPGQTSFPDNCPLIIETHHFTFLCTERTYKTSQYQHYPRQRIHMYGFFLPCHLQDIISLTREREWERHKSFHDLGDYHWKEYILWNGLFVRENQKKLISWVSFFGCLHY